VPILAVAHIEAPQAGFVGNLSFFNNFFMFFFGGLKIALIFAPKIIIV
jgi:hypothetical protein